MSRILKIMVALLAIAAIAAPVMAEDRLSLSGSMQVRGHFYDFDSDIDADDESAAWNDQRLRIAGKLSVAEGVSVNFRFDATESEENQSGATPWGNIGQNTHRRADIQFDKAYLQLEKNDYTFTAGQQYFSQGLIGTVGDHVGTGFILKRSPVALFHTKTVDDDITETDASLTGAQFSFGNDTMAGKVFGIYDQGTASGDELYALGFSFDSDLEAVNVKGELNYFDGENAAGVDEKGLQLYVDVSAEVNETVTVGGLAIYAKAEDTDDQITRVTGTGFAGFSPQTYGYFSTDYSIDFDIFDPSGLNQGSMAGSLYADVKLNDDLSSKFAAMYFTVDDDHTADMDGFILNASASYALMANTKLNVGINYMNVDEDGTDVDVVQAMTGLYVNF
ncbi:MAG: porin [Chloroflexi bacterium]|nr:porin [Chloroflexota bacterium]